MSKVEIVQYSERAIAVFGDTKPFINELKELGGKFNPALSNENEKKPGWIYPKKMQDKVQELVSKINAGVVKPSESSSSSKSYSSSDKPAVDTKMFMALVSRVERLEQELKLLHNKMGISQSAGGKNETQLVSGVNNDEYESEPEEEEVSAPRLMKRK